MATTDSAPVLTLTKHHQADQAVQQYAYDPAVIDQAVMLGDMKKMAPEMRLAFYKAVCLSVGLNPLTQPFTVLERQDKTTWLYANSSCAQQLASLYRISFRDIEREQALILGEPFYCVRVTAVLPDGRSVPSQAVVSLTKKKKRQKGAWPDGDPKFVDALDSDGEPLLIPLRGDALANAIMKADTKGMRRATLAAVGLGWMQGDFEGRAVAFNVQTGVIEDDPREIERPRLLERPTEQGKATQDHVADLYGDPPTEPAGEAGAEWIARIEAALLAQGSDIERCMAWAEDTLLKKPRTYFSLEDYQQLLQAVQAMAQKKGTAKARTSRAQADTLPEADPVTGEVLPPLGQADLLKAVEGEQAATD